MTNLHVVSDAIAYQEGLQTSDGTLDKSKFLNYAKSNYKTSFDINQYYFKLSTWSDANNKYQDVVTNYLDNGVDFSNVATTENGALKSVEIITDCDNSNIELFSGKNYNIDIAIVKISLDFSNNLKLLDFQGNRPNTYQNYLNASSSQKQRDLYYDENKNIYVGGNPVNANTLITKCFSYDSWDAKYRDWKDDPIPILSLLREPYYLKKNLMNKDFHQLKEGASGSEVFLTNYDQNNLWETLPFALIWGVEEFGNNENKLGILPLVVDSPFYGVDVQYNIYENFKNELSKL